MRASTQRARQPRTQQWVDIESSARTSPNPAPPSQNCTATPRHAADVGLTSSPYALWSWSVLLFIAIRPSAVDLSIHCVAAGTTNSQVHRVAGVVVRRLHLVVVHREATNVFVAMACKARCSDSRTPHGQQEHSSAKWPRSTTHAP